MYAFIALFERGLMCHWDINMISQEETLFK